MYLTYVSHSKYYSFDYEKKIQGFQLGFIITWCAVVGGLYERK